MKDIINYYLKSLSKSTLTLKKKSILIEKPWALIDDDGEMQKLIFKKNGGLILSKNGTVSEGAWEYLPEAQSLLIDRGADKLLLREMFIDESVIIMKKDGSDNDFYTFANENNLPDLNVPGYLNQLRNEKFQIREIKLINGQVLHIHNAAGSTYYKDYFGHLVYGLGSDYSEISLPNGEYMTEDREKTFIVSGGRITDIITNLPRKLSDGSSFEISEGNKYNIGNTIGNKVTKKGIEIPDTVLIDYGKYVYEIRESRIAAIRYIRKTELAKGWEIEVEQKKELRVSKGDKIVESKPVNPIPDGSYRVKGKIYKIKIKNLAIA